MWTRTAAKHLEPRNRQMCHRCANTCNQAQSKELKDEGRAFESDRSSGITKRFCCGLSGFAETTGTKSNVHKCILVDNESQSWHQCRRHASQTRTAQTLRDCTTIMSCRQHRSHNEQ